MLLTLLSLLSSMSLANSVAQKASAFLGDYAKKSAIRLPLTNEDCQNSFGSYEAGYCYFDEENTVRLYQDEVNVKVDISVVFGAANMRDFSGYVTSVEGNVVTINELDSETEDYTSVVNGCQIKATFENSVITDLQLNDSCDPDLDRVVDAEKVN